MTPVLEAQGLAFGFGARPVFHDVSFAIQAGERVGLVGANGAGKSTLLWRLLGLLRGNGTVRIFGAPPTRAALARVGVVFQNPEDQLFMPSLADDLALPLLNSGVPAEAARKRALEVLREVGLEEYAAEPAAHLSLGQRKRAAIALALAGAPSLLVLDEPTAELDGRSVRHLAALLRRLPGAQLIASHHLAFLGEVAGRLVVLGEGSVLADGPAPAILADSVLLERAGLV
jgi:cobalt/nickel transport system ATP-binding protein